MCRCLGGVNLLLPPRAAAEPHGRRRGMALAERSNQCWSTTLAFRRLRLARQFLQRTHRAISHFTMQAPAFGRDPTVSHAPAVSGRETTSTMPHQWQRETSSLLDTARRFQAQSIKDERSAEFTRTQTAHRVQLDSSSTHSAIAKKVSDTEKLKSKAESELDLVLNETQEMKDEMARAEQVLEIMKDPLQVADDCLNTRARRPIREQTRDAVERALQEQGAAARHGMRMLQGVLDAGEREMKHLQSVREKLEEDIERKRVALEVDSEVLNMDAGWSASSKSEVLNRSASLPHMWRQRTEAICEESERLRATCKRLRIKSHAIQQESFNVEKSTREVAIRSAVRKVQDTNALAVSIENELVATVDKINQADASKISVEESLHAKHGPLALARSRLQIRTSRPAQEQVRDGAETSLEREISEIEQSISKLSIQLSRLNTDISHMDVTKLRLENDLKDKREALDLEAEVEHRQRELGLRINAAFEN